MPQKYCWLVSHCWYVEHELRTEECLVHVATSLDLAELWLKADYGGKHHASDALDDPDHLDREYFEVYRMPLDSTQVWKGTVDLLFFNAAGEPIQKPPTPPWGETEHIPFEN